MEVALELSGVHLDFWNLDPNPASQRGVVLLFPGCSDLGTCFRFTVFGSTYIDLFNLSGDPTPAFLLAFTHLFFAFYSI